MQDWVNDWPMSLLREQLEVEFQWQEEDEDEEETLVMLYELDDAKYINHGHYEIKEENFIRSIKYQNLAPKTVEEVFKSKASIALKDIPACTELIENYLHEEENLDGDEEEKPAWYFAMLGNYDGVKKFLSNPPYKFSSTVEANVGSFRA